MRQDFIFTSESVTDGHPDKLCDQVSDAIVDRFLVVDPFARVSAECAVARGILFLAVQFAAGGVVDVSSLARQVIAAIGYTGHGFDAEHCTVLASLTELPAGALPGADERAPDPAALDRLVARDHATVFGFACAQTRALMPLPIWLAHKLARRLAAVRLDRTLPYLLPDGKVQVGVEFRAGRPHRIHSLTVLTAPGGGGARLRDDLRGAVIGPAFADEDLRPDDRTAIFVNPEDAPPLGGPAAHAGLTGRKTGIDTYGEFARHSGAALSGKDPSRIDRIGAYAARHAAKCVVAAGLAAQCEVALCYAIGQARPVSVQVETFGTARLPEEAILERVLRAFDFRPGAVLNGFALRHLPQRRGGSFFARLACYGQVGRQDLSLPWEDTARAVALAG